MLSQRIDTKTPQTTPHIAQVNILLIGAGQYGRSCYLSYFKRHPTAKAMIAACLDVEAQRTTIEAYLHNNFEESSRPMLYTFTPPMQEEHAERITKIIAAHQISAAILSTPPEHRMFYMQLFLALGIHVLADKPLTAPYGVSVDPAASEQILKDYESVRDAYKAALAKTPGLVFDVMVQRRYHPVFQFAISKLKEVASITGCGLTHFQSTHADGQWRLPHGV